MGRNYRPVSRAYRKGERPASALSMAVYILLSCALLGAMLGCAAAGNMDGAEYSSVTQGIYQGLNGLSSPDAGKAHVFRQGFFKYARTVGLVWVLGFVWGGYVLQGCIIGFKGFGAGYMTWVFIMEFGARGVGLSVVSFLLQNICLILLCIYIAQADLAFALGRLLGKGGKAGYPPELILRVVALLIALTLAMGIGLYEAYICQALCSIIW